MKLFSRCLPILVLCSGAVTLAQVPRPSYNIPAIPTPAVNFLTFAPDARSAAMGDAGVALSPDANSAYWNASKLAFADRELGASVSFTPWLQSLTDGMWLGYASVYKKVGKGQAVAFSVNNFNWGKLPIFTGAGQSSGSFNAKEFTFNGTYSQQLGKNFSMGITFKYITSNLVSVGILSQGVIKNSSTIAGDLSAFYQKLYKNETTGNDFSWSFGAVLSNFGGKINYLEGENFIPTNLKIGAGLSFTANRIHRFNFVLDATKLLVPTPYNGYNSVTRPLIKGIVGSFSDAPGGLKEELKEIIFAGGGEYWYKDFVALRGGYFGENKNKGNRKYFTAGAGVKILHNYNVDFSYLFPVDKGSLLANTFRITASAYLGKGE